MCVCLGLLDGIVIVCFVRDGWFVLIGLICWCGLECSCRSGSCCLMVVGGVGLVIVLVGVVWMCILGVRLLGCLRFMCWGWLCY